jgi:hypothetical protein
MELLKASPVPEIQQPFFLSQKRELLSDSGRERVSRWLWTKKNAPLQCNDALADIQSGAKRYKLVSIMLSEGGIFLNGSH